MPAIVAAPLPGRAVRGGRRKRTRQVDRTAGSIEVEIEGVTIRIGRGAEAQIVAATWRLKGRRVIRPTGVVHVAEQNYLQIIKAQPNQFDYLHLLGVIFSQRGNHAEAVRQIDVALKINPKAASAHNNRGLALQGLKRLDEALASYDKALALKPETAHRADSDRECRTMSL